MWAKKKKKLEKREKWGKNRSRHLQQNTLEWPGGSGRHRPEAAEEIDGGNLRRLRS